MDTPPLCITADEINCLIYSYFKDSGEYKSVSSLVLCRSVPSGFTHSAFTLCSESALQNSPWFCKHIPRGELIELLSKALLYIEVESHWRGNELMTGCKNKFSLLEHHVCSSDAFSIVSPKSPASSSASRPAPPKAPTDKTPDEDISTSLEGQAHHTSTEPSYDITSAAKTNGTLISNDISMKRKISPHRTDGPAEKRAKREPDDVDVGVPIKMGFRDANSSQTPSDSISPVAIFASRSQDTDAAECVHTRTDQTHSSNESLNDKAILMLPGHRTEVFVCSFNPQRYTQLATGYAYNFTLIFLIYVFTYE